MADQTPNPKRRPLSEISHLFLSNLRENGEMPRPQRIPPGQRQPPAPKSNAPDPSRADFRPLESKQSESVEFGGTRRRVTGIIGSHLNGKLLTRVSQYAAAQAAEGAPVGLIIVDASEFRLEIVEAGQGTIRVDPTDVLDARQMRESLLELNHDVDRWLLVTPDPRRENSRALMSMCDDWLMLCTCDHDGVVSGYRSLKGMAEGGKNPVRIALLDPPGVGAAERVFGKLAAVCRQFLDWNVAADTPVTGELNAQQSIVLWCRAIHDKAQLASAPQWKVVEEFLGLEPDESAQLAHFGPETQSDDVPPQVVEQLRIDPIAQPQAKVEQEVEPTPAVAQPSPQAVPTSQSFTFTQPPAEKIDEVIDLPPGVSVLSAVLGAGGDLLPTPIPLSMCPGAVVAVSRSRQLVLVAQLGGGLAGLGTVGSAVKWLEDSAKVIAMAMPQLSIDMTKPIRVQLLVDFNDRSATGLMPLLGHDRIAVRCYRRLRWGDRTGLLLDAA